MSCALESHQCTQTPKQRNNSPITIIRLQVSKQITSDPHLLLYRIEANDRTVVNSSSVLHVVGFTAIFDFKANDIHDSSLVKTCAQFLDNSNVNLLALFLLFIRSLCLQVHMSRLYKYILFHETQAKTNMMKIGVTEIMKVFFSCCLVSIWRNVFHSRTKEKELKIRQFPYDSFFGFSAQLVVDSGKQHSIHHVRWHV